MRDLSASLMEGAWEPLCGTGVYAIPLRGTWNYEAGVSGGGSKTLTPGQFTFACRGAALAKCAEFGYRPWSAKYVCQPDGSCEKRSLEDLHQTCTRVLRADYCGDGTPNTIDGNLVNVYDAYGIEVDTEGWKIEAEWDVDGARCIRRSRSGKMPRCVSEHQLPNCGDKAHFEVGALFMTELHSPARNEKNPEPP